MSTPINLSFSSKTDSLAIVGMDICVPGCSGLESFERGVYRGMMIFKNEAGNSSSTTGEGIIASECDDLVKRTIYRALVDVSLNHPGLSLELIINSHSHDLSLDELRSWLQERLHLTDISIKLPQEEFTLTDYLDQARQYIQAGQGIVVALVDFIQGEGCAVLVLASSNAAFQLGLKPYALIQSSAECSPAFPEGIARTCLQAFREADIPPEQVGYLEVTGTGDNLLIGENFTGVIQAYQQMGKRLVCALGELNTSLALVGMIKAAACLSERILPALPEWRGRDPIPALENSPFYILEESQSWFKENKNACRKAAVIVFDSQGNFTHIILEEVSAHSHPIPRSITADDLQLFLLTGNSLPEIMAKILDCQNSLVRGDDLAELSRRLYFDANSRYQEDYCLALIGRHSEDLLSEVGFSLKGVSAAFDKHSEWQTPAGSYFTADPQGRKGRVAFVYPGAFNSSLGMGRDLFYLFPRLHEDITCLTEDIASAMHTRQLYPRSLGALKKEELSKLEAELLDDPVTMLTSGTGFAVLFTLIMQNIFSIKPGAAFGYSLGENSLMYASGIWGNADEARLLLETSPLFHTRLAGRQDAIRQFWDVPAVEGEEKKDAPLWANYLLMMPPQKVNELLTGEDHVYLTHINTPRQVVIGGYPQACLRVIEKLGCTHMKMPFNYAIHCQPVVSEYSALFNLHHWQIQKKPDFPVYLSADCQPVTIDQEVIADKIARGLSQCVNYAEMTRRVYDDGARIFIELGAGNNCSKWIDDTLHLSPHLSAAINRTGVDDLTSILRLMARLSSHRVKLDLSSLYTGIRKGLAQC